MGSGVCGTVELAGKTRFAIPSFSRYSIPPTTTFQGGKPEVAPTNAVISSVLRPDGHRISAAFFAAAGADPSGAGPLPGYLHKRLLGGPFAPLVSAAYGGTPGASSAAMPRPHRWLLSLEHAGADPVLNVCDALLQSRSPTLEADQERLPIISLSQGMSSSGDLLTAGPVPAIATCCALHERLPRPTLEPGRGRRTPPLLVYAPLSFLAHAAEIAPVRITVIDSAMLASRVSSVRFQAKSPHPDYSKSVSGETFLASGVLGGPPPRLNG